jgi:hypothetical protein
MVPQPYRSAGPPWTRVATQALYDAVKRYGAGDWGRMAAKIPELVNRSEAGVRARWHHLVASAKQACAATGSPWTGTEHDVLTHVRNLVEPSRQVRYFLKGYRRERFLTSSYVPYHSVDHPVTRLCAEMWGSRWAFILVRYLTDRSVRSLGGQREL